MARRCMPKSTTRFVKTKKIADSGIASVLARLMMIVNDIGIVNELSTGWNKSEDKRKDRRGGGRVLLSRVLMSYTYEALEVIKEIRDSPALMKEVQKCSEQTRKCFEIAKAFLDTDDYKKVLVRFRNNVGFHYDGKLADRAVKEIANDFPDEASPMTLGEDPLDWHFELGDKIQDKIVVRYIFEVTKDKEIGPASDEIAGRVYALGEKLTEFAGYFIWERTNYEPR